MSIPANFSSLLLLLSIGVLVLANIYQEPVKYNFCKCPCDGLTEVQVTQMFETNASCIYITNKYTRGYLFTTDKKKNGVRYLYHDTTYKQTHKQRYPHTAFWKLYYPWKNISLTQDDVPLVMQNILLKEFMVSNAEIEGQNDRVVALTSTLTRFCLWYFFGATGNSWKIKNIARQEYMFTDVYVNHDTDQGRVYTDILKRDHAVTDHLGIYVWEIDPCYH